MTTIELPTEVIDAIADRIVEKLKTAEHDGCRGCVFTDVEKWELPCRECKQSKKDYWREK